MRIRLLCFIVSLVATAQLYGSNYKEFTKETYVRDNQHNLPYRLFKPDDKSKKYPLVILLHGIGERGSDNEKQLDNNGVGAFLTKLKDFYPSIIIVPQCPYSSDTLEKSYWTNAITETSQGLQFDLNQNEPTLPMQMLISLITELINSGEVDQDQIYIGGISMGAFGVYELLWRMPNLFKAAFPICGASTVDVAKLQSYVGKTRIWAFHGSLDDIVPFSLGNKTYDAIQKIPDSSIKYTIYDGVYHNCWDNAFKEKNLIPWIFGFNSLDKGYYKIGTRDSIDNVMTNNLNNCTVKPFNGNNSQQWLIYDGETAGTYRILNADGSNLYLTSNGSNLDLNSYINNDSQLWKILETDGSSYISSVKENTNLTIKNSELILSDNEIYGWNISFSKIYIVGNAISTGWNINNAEEMTLQQSKNGIFKWTGVISANGSEFKFLTTKDSNWLPSINAAYTTEQLDSSEQEYKLSINSNYKHDYKFGMKNPGVFEVLVDIINRKMSVRKNYEEVYLVGEVTDSGWDNNNGIKLTKSSTNVFEWSGFLKPGAFKFLTHKGTWLYSLSSLKENQLITENDSLTTYPIKFNTSSDSNFNYKIQNSGFYNIIVDMNNETLSIVRKKLDKLWLTGSAIKNDFIEIAKDNLYTGTKFRYTGNLDNGTLEIVLQNPFTLDSVYIIPNSNNYSIIANTSINFSKKASWLVPVTSNNYRISLDFDQLSLKGVIFTPRSDNYYLVGGASPDQWNINEAIPFIQDPDDPNTYTLHTTLIPKEIFNGNQFKILQQKNWWGYSFHPTGYNKLIDNTKQLYEEQYGYGGNNDYKWIVDDSHSGNYLIILNLLDETIQFIPELDFKNSTCSINNYSDTDISVITIGNEILIRNKSDINIDIATLTDLASGKIYSKQFNKAGDFYLATNIPFGTYIVNISRGKLLSTKKIVIK